MRILLAHDGSSDASHAIELARTIPWPAGSVMRAITVIEPLVGMTAWAGGPLGGYSLEVDQQIEQSRAAALDAVVERLRAPGGSVDGRLVRGRPASVIVDEARRFDADLVIVGSRGHGAIASLVLGSVSGEVVDHAPCPVLVARGPSVGSAVLAVDGSPSATTALAVAATWPMFERLPIRVISVAEVLHPWHTGIAPTMYQQVLEAYSRDLVDARTEHQRTIDDAVEILIRAGRVATGELRVGDPAAEILAVAGAMDDALVVLGSRGRTGLTRLLLGSVARNVVHGGTASVLIVREAVELPKTG